MTAETITPNDDTVAACDNYGAISTREPCCDHGRQLDHLDTMLHELIRMTGNIQGKMSELDPLVPLIPRALALLDPGAAMRRGLKRSKPSV